MVKVQEVYQLEFCPSSKIQMCFPYLDEIHQAAEISQATEDRRIVRSSRRWRQDSQVDARLHLWFLWSSDIPMVGLGTNENAVAIVNIGQWCKDGQRFMLYFDDRMQHIVHL